MDWIKARLKERTSWGGGGLIALGLIVLFFSSIANYAAYFSIVYGAWSIWKSEK